MSTTNKVLILGAGYLGQRLITPFANRGFLVETVTRNSTPEHPELHQHHYVDGDSQNLQDILKASQPDLIILCWAPGSRSQGDQGYIQTYQNALVQLEKAFESHRPKHIIYTSSTSVYAEQSGQWVDENIPLTPHTDRSRVLIEAEKKIMAWSEHMSVQILRCSGIYGPDRWPGLRLLKKEGKVPGNGEAWVNLVHVDDIVEAILLCSNSEKSSLYNLSALSIKRQELYQSIALKHQLPEPVFETYENQTVGRRIQAQEIKDDLSWNPKHIQL